MALEHVQELFDFIQQSPSCFHVIENVKKQLTEQGFEELCENKNWQIKEGGKYFVTRNLSSVIAFKVPTKDFKSFHIVASHSDSPTFKIKDHPEQMVKGKYVQLNTERYGGMIYSTWFDRPLSIAGRALVKTETGVATKLLNIDRDLLVIPNLAVHMDRTVNDGMKYNPQVNLLPLYGDAASKDTFNKLVAEACGTAEENIISTDLFLYNRTAPTVWGAHNEYMSCAKLDDLECAFSSLKAFLKGENSQSISVCAIFDNEEVGSSTKQGANSTFSFIYYLLSIIFLQVPVPLPSPHNKPSRTHQRHGLGGNDRQPDAVHTDEERQGQNRHDLEQQRAQKADGRRHRAVVQRREERRSENVEPGQNKADGVQLHAVYRQRQQARIVADKDFGQRPGQQLA